MSGRPPVYYAYMLIAFGLVILGISMWAMIRALSYYDSGDYPQFFVYGIMASVGTVLALSSITQMRRRMVMLQSLATRVLSVVLCASCGFKVVRTFTPGDYIAKEVGQCQQCKGTMRVDSIYAEEQKSK
jgi:glucan phosphoethanolaminetransferase (alkaline phosphatase superfamily)